MSARSSIARVLDAGLSVAMVNLGDVSICATAYDVLDELRRRGYATQMIPGITSFCAVAATLGTSLTDRDSPLHIYPDETGNLDMALELSGTKVLMKSGKAIGETAAALSCRGLAKGLHGRRLRSALAAHLQRDDRSAGEHRRLFHGDRAGRTQSRAEKVNTKMRRNQAFFCSGALVFMLFSRCGSFPRAPQGR